MSALLIMVFVLGYAAIAFEHPLRLNKAASALITGVLCWTVYILSSHSHNEVTEQLIHHIGEISSILFFLLGAMTIVELIDSHNGFEIIISSIHTTSKRKLLITISIITFFLSAVLDNLTTAIVMTSLTAKLLNEKEDKLWFAGMIVIAANAGGAWSPLGDVTTTMLWIGGQITALNIIYKTIFASLIVCLLPMLIVAYRFKGKYIESTAGKEMRKESGKDGKIILFSGIGLLLFVPLFKTVTHLPPFMGMLLALGIIWIITTVIHSDKDEEAKKKYNVANALRKIDAPSILFFLGILLAVAALESFGLLKEMAGFLTTTLKNDYLIGSSLGVLSAIVDNVPLVAAAQGMYDLTTYPPDHPFWEFLALTTGTGGSMIIIGSAAGVAVMGIENIRFGWYLKRISWLALIGFVAGSLVYVAQQLIFHS
ncbi:MAG: sodium:proton antiporter [Chitinophagaceae bacterium]|nr:MAG: sodium:proton antiporter [Chitinophagaceae bacterium]